MAKKSFLIYIDSLDILDELSDEEAGRLFKAIKSAQKGEECELDPVTRIALSPFKSQFARDLEKYETICERNKNNGLKGGRPKTEANQKNPVGLTGGEANPKNLDSDSDSDSDSDKNKDHVDESTIDQPKKRPSKAKGLTEFPDGFEITESMVEWFTEQDFKYIDLGRATDKWVDAMKAKGSRYKDWTAAWRNGMNNAEKWSAPK